MQGSEVGTRTGRPRSRTSGRFSLFRHHGIWGPGVRLFRQLQFRSKALIITAVLLMPVVLLAWSFLKEKADSIEFSRKERAGLMYIRETIPLVRLGQAYRMYTLQMLATGATSTPEVTLTLQARDAQMKKLEAVESTLGADLGTSKALATVRAAAEAEKNAHPTTADGAHASYVDAVIRLIAQAGDGSNLTLDPDLDTYYLMDASLGAMPVLVEGAAKLREMSAAAATSGQPPSVEAQRAIVTAAVTTEIFESRVETALDKVFSVHAPYRAEFKADDLLPHLRAFRSHATSGTADGTSLIREGTEAVDGLRDLQSRMVDRLDGLLQDRIDGAARERGMVMTAVSLALLLGAYLFYCFYKVTQGGLHEVRRHLVAMTDGDLTTRPNPWGRDEAAALMLSLGDMQASLRTIVSRVRGSSASIVTASSDIASASMDLSARTEQSAANLEESAASMEEISSTVKHTADNLREASQAASSNARAAMRGGAVIDDVVSTMQAINTSSKQISDIIGTIDGIAFQTNILALNAAVEAARAGEQGRGFAVVASEVRSLAQRSAKAAKEIKTLITASVEKIESGTRVVRGAGDTMQEIQGNAQRMSVLLVDISTAASEQSSGVSQIGVAVTDLDRMTQQNAALVEQTATAASGLRDQAVGLATEVAQFKLPA